MKRFYLAWFLLCSVWGYLSQGFPADVIRSSVKDVPVMLLGSMASFFALTLLLCRLSRSASDRGMRFGIDLRPWDDPLGVFQFVFVTFIFVGFWGIALSLLLVPGRQDFALLALAIGGGGLLGGIAATRWLERRDA